MPTLPSTNIGSTGSGSFGRNPVGLMGQGSKLSEVVALIAKLFGGDSELMGALAGYTQSEEAKARYGEQDAAQAYESAQRILANRGNAEYGQATNRASAIEGMRNRLDQGIRNSAQMLGGPAERNRAYASAAALEHALKGNTMGDFQFGGLNHPDAGVNKYAAKWQPKAIPEAAKYVSPGALSQDASDFENARMQMNPDGAPSSLAARGFTGGAGLDANIGANTKRWMQRDSDYANSIMSALDEGESTAGRYYDQAEAESRKRLQEAQQRAQSSQKSAKKASKVGMGLSIAGTIASILPFLGLSEPEYKDIGEPMDKGDALDVVNKAPLYHYTYKFDSSKTPMAGIMADTTPEFTIQTPAGRMVHPPKAIGYLAGAIQQLSDRIDHLSKKGRAR